MGTLGKILSTFLHSTRERTGMPRYVVLKEVIMKVAEEEYTSMFILWFEVYLEIIEDTSFVTEEMSRCYWDKYHERRRMKRKEGYDVSSGNI